MNSKDKGKRGERELAEELTKLMGVTHVRAAQVSGLYTADVVAIDDHSRPIPIGLHWECKRNEALNIYAAIEQAENDSKGDVPIVAHRRNNKPWLITIPLTRVKEFVTIMRDYL